MSPSQIVDAAAAAVDGARSVRYVGSTKSSLGWVEDDVQVFANGSAAGYVTVDVSGSSDEVRFVIAAQHDYLLGPASFWRSITNVSQAQQAKLAGHWVASDAVGSRLDVDILTLPAISQSLALENAFIDTAGTPGVVDGQQAISATSSNGLIVLWVTANSEVRPISVTVSGQPNQSKTFSNWNQGTPASPPVDAIPLGGG